MKLNVLNIKGEETGRQVELSDAVFAVEPNDHAIYLDVKLHLANKRQGTHKSKERAEITGSTRKLKKQKGTGTARCGSIKSPLFRGGGRAFGPRPRNYGFKLNKKVKTLARYSALTYKAQRQEIVIVEDFNFEQAKTKQYVDFVSNLKVADVKSTLVMGEGCKHVFMSSRNLPKATVFTVSDLNTYRILNNKCLILSETSVAQLNNQIEK